MSTPMSSNNSLCYNQISSSLKSSWKDELTQKYRSKEISNIAKVLASLETKATSSSKLMLASRFEQGVFNEASSLADYRKKIVRRLKKFQKKYGSSMPSESNEKRSLETQTYEQETRLHSLYSESLLFLLENSKDALHTMGKYGEEKAKNLRKHLESAARWAVEIGVIPDNSTVDFGDKSGGKVIITRKKPRPMGELDRISHLLHTRLDNIRSHVVKMTHPDLFYGECLGQMEERLEKVGISAGKLVIEGINKLFPDTSVAVCHEGNKSKQINALVKEHIIDIMNGNKIKLINIDEEKCKSNLIKCATLHRSAIDMEEKDACLFHLSSIRDAAQVFISYLQIENKSDIKGYMRKIHCNVGESCLFLANVPLRKGKNEIIDVDSYSMLTNYIDYAFGMNFKFICSFDSHYIASAAHVPIERKESSMNVENINNILQKPFIDNCVPLEPERKVMKTLSHVTIRDNCQDISPRHRIMHNLFRMPPFNFLSSLKKLNAEFYNLSTLIIPSNTSRNTRTFIKLSFGNEFKMIICLRSLLVFIHPLTKNLSKVNTLELSDLYRKLSIPRLLNVSNSIDISSTKDRTRFPIYSSTGINQFIDQSVMNDSALQHLTLTNLECISSKATAVLRKCFLTIISDSNVYYKSDDDPILKKELEILEEIAFLHFIRYVKSSTTQSYTFNM